MIRSVPLDVTQVALIEEIGVELMRRGDLRATTLLAVVLQWRLLGQPPAFSCDVDESGGMAEVVELHDYSRRVTPCA